MRRGSWWIAVWLMACGPSVPSEVRYRLVIDGAEPLAGTSVTLDGADAGTIDAAGTVMLVVPASVRPAAMHVAVSMPSPCGAIAAAVTISNADTAGRDDTIASQMASPAHFVLMYGSMAGTAGPRTTVLVDRDASDTRPLRIGEATIPAGTSRFDLGTGTCSPTASVRIGDEEIGTWHASSAVTLVSTTPVCHRLTSIGYGDSPSGPPVVFGQRVRVLESVPPYFLTPAPPTLSVAGDGRYVDELVRTECPTQSFAQIAAAARSCIEAMPSLLRAVDFDQDDVESAVHYVTCAYTEGEAGRIAQRTIGLHPEARDRVIAAMTARGFATGTL